MKEIFGTAEAVIYCKAQDEFAEALNRMEDHNQGYIEDNPKAIIEILNTNLPWVTDKPNIHYSVEGKQIIAHFNDEENV